MVDVAELNSEIISNPDHILTILEAMDYTNIRDRGNYYQFPHHDGDNMTANSVLKSTLHWEDYTRSNSGSLIQLVQNEMKCNFKQALVYMADWIGFKGERYQIKKTIKLPFNGFYKNLQKMGDDIRSQIQLPTYSEDILPPSQYLSNMWLEDGVGLTTQEAWGIRLDLNSNRILIPERNVYGELLGVKARLNERHCDDAKRWSMYKAFSKSKCLYGFYENYALIQRKKVLFIFEAEKSVAMASEWGIPAVSIGGHNISDIQARYIRCLLPEKIIVGFDAGIVEDEIRWNAEKLLGKNKIYCPKIGYIYDDTKLLLADKNSPTDNGAKMFQAICNNCIKWIEKGDTNG